MKMPNEKDIERLREEYPPGTRIALVAMDDTYSKLMPGDRGEVTHIDDTGTVFVNWDCGSGLGLVFLEDRYRKLTSEELAEEQEEQQDEEMSDGGMNMGM